MPQLYIRGTLSPLWEFKENCPKEMAHELNLEGVFRIREGKKDEGSFLGGGHNLIKGIKHHEVCK